MAIGDGLVDPINQLDYGYFLYSIGLVDENQAQYFHDGANQTAELINQGDYIAAFHVSFRALRSFHLASSSSSASALPPAPPARHASLFY